MRLLVLALLVLALAGMRVARETKELTAFFVLDASDSIPQPQREFARTFVENATRAMGQFDKAGLVVFGRNAAMEQPAQAPLESGEIKSIIDRGRSNLQDGLGLAMAGFSPWTQKRLVVMSDGNQNAGDALAAARAAAAN